MNVKEVATHFERVLACAIVDQAVKDYRAGDPADPNLRPRHHDKGKNKGFCSDPKSCDLDHLYGSARAAHYDRAARFLFSEELEDVKHREWIFSLMDDSKVGTSILAAIRANPAPKDAPGFSQSIGMAIRLRRKSAAEELVYNQIKEV